MIRFRCTGCNRLLGVADRKAGQRITCPACKNKVVVPAARSQESPQLDLARSGSRTARSQQPVQEEEILDALPVEEEEELDDLEIIEEVEMPRRSPKSKRRRQSSGGGEDPLLLDYYRRRENSHQAAPLALMCIPAPLVLFVVIGSFLLNPLCGMASLFWAVGWIWLNLIAAEEGAAKILCINFVPFYSLIYALQNTDRVWLPLVL